MSNDISIMIGGVAILGILVYFVSKNVKNTVLLRISQFITWPITYIIFNLKFIIHINGRENLKKIHRPFIIIANHFSSIDSFLFRQILGIFTPHLPLRFTAVKKFNWKKLTILSHIGVIPFIYKIFGVMIITPGLGIQKNLEESKHAIAQGENVVVYPEGGITKEKIIAPFKIGAAVLASETGASVLPVSFCLGKRKFIRKVLTINIGEPMHVSSDANPDETTKIFHDTITKLYTEC